MDDFYFPYHYIPGEGLLSEDEITLQVQNWKEKSGFNKHYQHLYVSSSGNLLFEYELTAATEVKEMFMVPKWWHWGSVDRPPCRNESDCGSGDSVVQ